MVRLTAELIEDSFQFINPVREYELSLRGYKIGLIENLGATLNQFDTIDFSDNDIKRLDSFPFLPKIKSLLFNNNKIANITSDLEHMIPNLETLILTNNNIEDLVEVEKLSKFKHLQYVSFLRNPVASLKHYRLYTIYRLPHLRILDFKKVKQTERDEAKKLYKGKKLKGAAAPEKPKTFVPGEQLDKLTGQQQQQLTQQQIRTERVQPSKEDIDAIKLAISQAKSIEEVDQLNAALKAGIIPAYVKKAAAAMNAPPRQQQQKTVEEENDDEEEMAG